MRGNTSPVDASDSSPPPGAPIAPASAARAAARRVGRAERLSCGEAAARLRGWRRRVAAVSVPVPQGQEAGAAMACDEAGASNCAEAEARSRHPRLRERQRAPARHAGRGVARRGVGERANVCRVPGRALRTRGRCAARARSHPPGYRSARIAAPGTAPWRAAARRRDSTLRSTTRAAPPTTLALALSRARRRCAPARRAQGCEAFGWGVPAPSGAPGARCPVPSAADEVFRVAVRRGSTCSPPLQPPALARRGEARPPAPGGRT